MAAPKGQFLWNNQQVVHVFVEGQSEPWASIYTKRPAGLDVTLTGPKGIFGLGRIAELAIEREILPQGDRDQIKLRFVASEDLNRGDLNEFLKEHASNLSTSKFNVKGGSRLLSSGASRG